MVDPQWRLLQYEHEAACIVGEDGGNGKKVRFLAPRGQLILCTLTPQICDARPSRNIIYVWCH